MLEKIRNLAMEKLASEEEVNAFMEGFEKEASLTGVYNAFNTIARDKNGISYVAGNLLKDNVARVGVGLGAALLGAAIVKGVHSGSSAITNNQLRNRFEMSLAQVMANNRAVKGSRPEKAKEYAETIFKFAPHVASDPNLLGSILANAVLGEGIDPMTIKSLVDLEGRYNDNNKTTPFLGIKT